MWRKVTTTDPLLAFSPLVSTCSDTMNTTAMGKIYSTEVNSQIKMEVGPGSHHARDIDVVLYQPISQPSKFSEDLLMNIVIQKRLNTSKPFEHFIFLGI